MHQASASRPSLDIPQSSLEALPRQDRDLDHYHIQPRAAHQGVDKLDCSGPFPGRLRREAPVGYGLAGAFVETNHGPMWIVEFLVEVQNVRHPQDEGRTLPWWDHPLALQVRLEGDFFGVCLTISSEFALTCPRSTIRSAKGFVLQPPFPLEDPRMRV